MITQGWLAAHLLVYGQDAELMRRYQDDEEPPELDDYWVLSWTLYRNLNMRNRPDEPFVFECADDLQAVVGFEDFDGRPCIIVGPYLEEGVCLGLVPRKPPEPRAYTQSSN